MSRKYSVSPYRKNWLVRFRKQKVLLAKILGENIVGIHHVGSTSIPGMSAKPSVDVLVIVKNLRKIDELKRKFEGLGYILRTNYVTPNSRLLEKFKGDTKLYNIHLLPQSHIESKRLLNTKNYFIAHPAEIKKYEELKQKLYRKYPNDYTTHRKGKTEYLNQIQNKANKWTQIKIK